MQTKVIFVSPTYNASYHLKETYDSLKEQTNDNWKWVILNDMSNDDTKMIAENIVEQDELKRVTLINHTEKKFALKGLYESLISMKESDDEIIAVMDGDDSLCNENTVDIVLSEYKKNKNLDSLWTAHSWDINGMNISRDLPEKINPYQYPWVSSHLKTFRLEVFKKINEDNFKDLDGEWFQRGYDQALYLPILYLSKERKFLNEICYLYRINSNSFKVRSWKEKNQMDTVRLVRSRGLLE